MTIFSFLPPFFLFFGLCLNANAFEFSPSVMRYDSSGRGASQKYTAHNSHAEPVAIEISSKTREIDEEGKELLKPTNDFTIYPKQFTLQPGDSRTIKVTYVGPTPLSKESAYRIVAEQLSIDMKKVEQAKSQTKIAIDFNFKYETSAYVTPPGAKSKVQVDEFKFTNEAGKGAAVELFISNSGTQHQIFKDWSVEFEMADGEKIRVSKKEMPQFNVLAGNKIKVKLAGIEKLKSKPLVAKLFFEQSE